MNTFEYKIPSKCSILLTALFFAVGSIIMYRFASFIAGFFYHPETIQFTLTSNLLMFVMVILISFSYRITMQKKMVKQAEYLRIEKEKLLKTCPGFRSETCKGRKIVENTQAVLESVPRLHELLQAHLREITNITENSALSIIKRLSDVQKESARLLLSLGESKQMAENFHINAKEQIADSKKQVTEMGSYKTLRETQIHGDKKAITDIVTLITELKPLTDLISNVARQIKILSLNAVIQAGNSGAAEGGFKVVAQEMKNLTCQSEDASVRIEKGIQQVVEMVNTNLVVLTSDDRIANEMNWLTTFSAATEKIASEFENAVTELEKLSGDSQSAVDSISRSIFGVLEQAQFQDISRQQIEQVQTGISMCGERMADIVQLLSGADTNAAVCSPLDDTLRILKSNYTMHSQRVVHESVLNGGEVQNNDGQPMIELF